jgi:demethylmenaquinone methyltransferase/2-methoxy-6-polyprenyl-1,4-benzoquinol methylase
MKISDRTVDFGFEKVAIREKAERVRAVFESVAGKYDVMNDLMSFGVHRLWKRFTLSLTGLKPGQNALDVAGGTGDLALGLLRQVGKDGRVVLSAAIGCSMRAMWGMWSAWSPMRSACPSATIPSIASPSASACAM